MIAIIRPSEDIPGLLRFVKGLQDVTQVLPKSLETCNILVVVKLSQIVVIIVLPSADITTLSRHKVSP